MGGRAVTQVLSVASEVAPVIKTGGLADVAGALPAALAPFGVTMRTLMPGYPQAMRMLEDAQPVAQFQDCFGGHADLLAGKAGGLDLLVLDAPHLFERGGGPYLADAGTDWPDNPERFAALSWVASEIANGAIEGWQPDIVHCHDWQAGLAPYYIARSPAADRVKTIITVHNIAFQGLAPAWKMGALKIAPVDFTPDGMEYWGQISALKAGLVFADWLTTVSPTYAAELMTAEFGMGLEGVMRARRDSFTGILNGIDEQVWSPATDPAITPYKAARGKASNKAALRKEFGLRQADGPLCVVVSRLTEQKGLDLLIEALPTLLDRGGQLALLGSGDKGLEAAFQRAAGPDVGVRIGYDEALSHRMMAGGDAILVPSRFEPCGLTQLYGLRYGAIPLVALTGGLADTVVAANPASMAHQVATGIQFHPVTAAALADALNRLCDLYADPDRWTKMQRNAMSQPVGWDQSAARYAELYESLLAAR
ncbi:glycogen synthase GlgA [Paracoccus tegillarcae]|uniref:Glycogen synthase n=1 Tax=Paracoccus tegillarcae TaxID=1529068 RepID=A0A2K9EW01_9RHOB|nr:glycogen synthase GlgA [Paracoccus tegillarcae]AUH33464.1 glycogen synthase GlgA [Paracoccus tegillarcae]